MPRGGDSSVVGASDARLTSIWYFAISCTSLCAARGGTVSTDAVLRMPVCVVMPFASPGGESATASSDDVCISMSTREMPPPEDGSFASLSPLLASPLPSMKDEKDSVTLSRLDGSAVV